MLRLGVIGLGSMGKNHARVCSELDSINLIGVCDTNKKVAEQIATRFQTTPYSKYSDLISLCDAAIIATPTISHYDIAFDLLSNGKHVLIEKPICETIAKGNELVELAEKEKLTLAIGHIERHNPVVSFAKDALKKLRFGTLLSLASKRVSNFPGRIRDVGVIFDFGVHDIDVMRYLAGEVSSVYARAGRYNTNIEFEDHAHIVLNFSNGLTGVIEVNWLTPVKIRTLQLTCSENFVTLDYINQSVQITSSSFDTIDEMDLFNIPIQYNSQMISLQKIEPLKQEIQDFINAIESQSPPLVTGSDGVWAIRIAEIAMQSYKTGREVQLV